MGVRTTYKECLTRLHQSLSYPDLKFTWASITCSDPTREIRRTQVLH